MSTSAPKPAAARVEPSSKALTLRGYVLAMQKMGLVDVVRPRLSPAARRLVDDPPPPSQWISLAAMQEITRIIAAERGLPAVRKFARTAAVEGIAPLWRSTIDGFLRLFGVSPTTLFARLNQFGTMITTGIQHEYLPDGRHRGLVVIHVQSDDPVESHTWEAFAGTLETVFDMCNTRGTVGAPETFRSEHGAASMRVTVAWE
jgi:hypothetical protein